MLASCNSKLSSTDFTPENSFTEVDQLNEWNFVGRSSDLPQLEYPPLSQLILESNMNSRLGLIWE